MDTNIEQLLHKIITAINISQHIEKIILYGSRARGDAEQRSDFDIAVICPDISTKDWLTICDNLEKLDTLLEINIVRFDTASKELQTRILKEGKVIYERNKN